MKVKVKDLKPNPFRNLDKYPIDKYKVEALKSSINETGFWDNLLARKNCTGYEIAYGHHRLMALMDLNIEEIDIPVKDISDELMLKIMANENLDQWGTNPSVVLETVRAIKDFGLTPDVDTIRSFLGKHWKSWVIKEAIETIADEDIDNAIANEFTKMSNLKEFRKAVKKNGIDRGNQIDIAREVSSKPTMQIEQAVDNIIGGVDKFDIQMGNLSKKIDYISISTNQLSNKILELTQEMNELGLFEISNIVSSIKIMDSYKSLRSAYKEYLKYFRKI